MGWGFKDSGDLTLRLRLLQQLPRFTNPQETGGIRERERLKEAQRGGVELFQAACKLLLWPLHHSFTRCAYCSFMISQLCLCLLLLLQVTCLQSVCRLSASHSSSRWGRSCAWPSLLWTLPTSLLTKRLWWSTSLPASQVCTPTSFLKWDCIKTYRVELILWHMLLEY